MPESRPLAAIILAAGKGQRMHSDLPKVLHKVGGKPMLLWVVDLARQIQADRILAVIGHGRHLLEEVLRGTEVETVIQEQQLGTGHAVLQTEPLLGDFSGNILVLSGDVPLLSRASLENLLRAHYHYQAGATLLTAILADPTGYGRICRKADGTLQQIVEHKDGTPRQLQIREINAGVYIFDSENLFRILKLIDNNNQQGEYYLPDVLPHIQRSGKKVALEVLADPTEISGINTQEQLIEINRIFSIHHETENHP